MELFGKVETDFDPDNLLNPGVLVDPDPLDAKIRYQALPSAKLHRFDKDFSRQVHRCTGVGKCVVFRWRRFSCDVPSYQATGDEKDSTRVGLASYRKWSTALWLLADGSPLRWLRRWNTAWRVRAVTRDDCPTGVDMAQFKSRVLYEKLKNRLRPRSHYLMGQLPRWGRLVTAIPGMSAIANFFMQTPGLKACYSVGGAG